MELFILRMTPYHERDFIVTALSPQGLITFKAVGLSKPTATLGSIVTLYSLIEAELEEKKSGLVITNAKSISKNYKIINDYSKLSVLNFIGESALRVLHDEKEVSEVYQFVRTAVLALESSFDPLSLAYIVLCKLLKATGYGLNIDSCVECGAKSNLIAINYGDGGFVCKQHYLDQNAKSHPAEGLNTIRYAFLVPLEKMLNIQFKSEILKPLFDELVTFYQDVSNTTLKSYTIIKKSFN